MPALYSTLKLEIFPFTCIINHVYNCLRVFHFREKELAKVVVKKDDIELIVSYNILIILDMLIWFKLPSKKVYL